MVFNSRITTPANTAELTPLRTTLKCTQGLIYQVDVFFPPGSSGLMGVQIRNQNVSLYPRNRDEWFIGDNNFLSFPDVFELFIDSNIIEIFTYNVDTDYEHLVQISIGILSKEQYIARFIPGRVDNDIQETLKILTDLVAQPAAFSNGDFIGQLAGGTD